MISRRTPLKILALFLGGVALNVVLVLAAEAVLEKKVNLPQHAVALQADRSPVALEALAKAFRARDMWDDFIAVPLIGCLIGLYAGFWQRKNPATLAAACLLPWFVFEILSESLRDWPASIYLRHFGMRAIEFLLAVFAAVLLRKFLDKTRSAA